MSTFTAKSPLILASTSPYRRALLERLGHPFTVRKPNYDEDVLKAENLPPLKLAKELAIGKALSARQDENEVVIGSDQLGALEVEPGDFEILGKPKTRARNIEQLLNLSNRKHTLITAVAVLHGTRRFEFHDQTHVTFRKLTEAEVIAIVDRDQAFDCAGGYKFEKAGISLIEKLECADPTAIEGLPLIQLSSCLRGLGYL